MENLGAGGGKRQVHWENQRLASPVRLLSVSLYASLERQCAWSCVPQSQNKNTHCSQFHWLILLHVATGNLSGRIMLGATTWIKLCNVQHAGAYRSEWACEDLPCSWSRLGKGAAGAADTPRGLMKLEEQVLQSIAPLRLCCTSTPTLCAAWSLMPACRDWERSKASARETLLVIWHKINRIFEMPSPLHISWPGRSQAPGADLAASAWGNFQPCDH